MTMKPNDAANAIPTEGFLHFLREKFRNMVIHNSNVFFRDLHYGVMAWFESKGKKVGHDESEAVARALVSRMLTEGVLTEVDRQSWRVNYPKFALPRVEKPAAAPKPAPAPAAPAPAAAAPATAQAPAAPSTPAQ